MGARLHRGHRMVPGRPVGAPGHR